MNKGARIAITGIGAITAGGTTTTKAWDAVLNKNTGLVEREYRFDGESVGKFFVHEIKDFDVYSYGLDGRILNEIKEWKEGEEIIDLYYFLAVIKMALDDSRLKIGSIDRESTGLMLAHENMGLDHFYQKVIDTLSFTGAEAGNRPGTKKLFLERFYKIFHRTGYELHTFMSLHHIAKVFDIHGFSLFLNNACASGLYALEAAADSIRTGKCRQVVVAAVDRSSVFKQIWFNNTNMLAKDGRIKPFARDRDGFTIGDGGAALVLETMDSAVKRKAGIYAEYIGGSFVLEGWKVTYPNIADEFYRNVILRAMDEAKVRPEEIDLIIPHGAGTNITDRYEAKAIVQVFGKNKRMPSISAFKPYIGHTLGSTAILETAIMLLAMKNGKIPLTLNCENVDSALGIDMLRETIDSDDIKIAMKTACGFAGFNGACVFKRI